MASAPRASAGTWYCGTTTQSAGMRLGTCSARVVILQTPESQPSELRTSGADHIQVQSSHLFARTVHARRSPWDAVGGHNAQELSAWVPVCQHVQCRAKQLAQFQPAQTPLHRQFRQCDGLLPSSSKPPSMCSRPRHMPWQPHDHDRRQSTRSAGQLIQPGQHVPALALKHASCCAVRNSAFLTLVSGATHPS